MELTGEMDVARFNALKQALSSAQTSELSRWAEDVLGERLRAPNDGDERALAALLLGKCQKHAALDALYDAVARERSTLRHTATTVVRAPQRIVASSLGPFTLDGRLGQGNSSTVYVALRDTERVRLRMLVPRQGEHCSAAQRYLRVTRAVSRLSHPNLPVLVEASHYDGHDVVAHRLVEGITLGKQHDVRARSIDDVWPLLEGMLDGLQALHEAGLAHGSLHEHNVLQARSGTALLLDPGSHFMRAKQPERDWPDYVLGSVAPELLRGEEPSPQSDLYALGVMLYKLVAGRGPFADVPRSELFAAQLARQPDPLSFLVRIGARANDLDDLGLELLDKDPRKRPQRAAHVRQRLLRIVQGPLELRPRFDEQELDKRTSALLEDPTNLLAAAVLEASVDQGADPLQVAEGLTMAAEQLPEGTNERERLTLRAATLYEHAGCAGTAEGAYRRLLGTSQNDEARAALERLMRDDGRHEELIELLLERIENEPNSARRAALLETVGQLEESLDDLDQALFAYTQALAANPESEALADCVERIAGGHVTRWEDALESLSQATAEAPPRHLTRLAKWYRQRLLRPDLALGCLHAALAEDPRCDDALRELSEIHLAARNYPELLRVLWRRIDAASGASAKAELYVETAALLEGPLGQHAQAQELYTRVFSINPAHAQAFQGTKRLHERAGDHAAVLDCLLRHADAVQGEARLTALCEAGRLAEDELRDPERALHLYERAAAEAPAALEPLHRLEALYRRTGHGEALEQNLRRQLDLAVTPRQHMEITVKLAAFKEREFMDGDSAARLLEDALVLEPESHQLRRELIRLHERLGHDERVLALWEAEVERAPHDVMALRAVADLATKRGEDARAIAALETLATLASSPSDGIEIWLDIAGRLEVGGDALGARRRYERVVEREPRHPAAWAGLRRVALAQGDVETALHALESELSFANSPLRRADLYAERARIHLVFCSEPKRAEAAAKRALELDESCAEAHVVLADCARQNGTLAEARYHYGRALSQRERLNAQLLGRVLAHQAEVLSGLGEAGEALAAAEQCAALLDADVAALLDAAAVMQRHGAHTRALMLCQTLLEKEQLTPKQRASALCGVGEAQAGLGDAGAAVVTLRAAAAAAPKETRALEALARLYRARESFAELVETLEAWADRREGDARWALLSEAGEIARERLHDPVRAKRLYLAVLAENPHHHRVLVNLLRLHGDAERWDEVVPVIVALAESRQEPSHRVPHLLTAARITDEKLNRPKEALGYLRRALELEADNPQVIEHMLRLARRTSDLALSEELYPRQIELALAAGLKPRALKLTEELYQLETRHGHTSKAIELLQHAHALDPGNNVYAERLSKSYTAQPELYFDEALRLQHERLAADATRVEPYQALLDLYWNSQRWDGVWCAAQALVLLRRASPRVEALYRRYHPREAATFTTTLSSADWTALVQHPDASSGVSAVFAIVEPALRRARGSDLKKLGLKPEMRFDPTGHEEVVVAALRRLARVAGIPLPGLYISKNQKRAIGLLRGTEPLLLLGPTALDPLPELQVAFTVASHLAYFRPGYGLRHLLPTARALKGTLLAAFKLVEPGLEVPAEFAEAVGETLPILKEGLDAAETTRLSQVIAGLLDQNQLVDLHHWLSGVDLTSDRFGLIACNDLTTALQLVKSADDRSSSVPRAERIKALFRYSVDPRYLELRARLGLNVTISSEEPLSQRAVRNQQSPASVGRG